MECPPVDLDAGEIEACDRFDQRRPVPFGFRDADLELELDLSGAGGTLDPLPSRFGRDRQRDRVVERDEPGHGRRGALGGPAVARHDFRAYSPREPELGEPVSQCKRWELGRGAARVQCAREHGLRAGEPGHVLLVGRRRPEPKGEAGRTRRRLDRNGVAQPVAQLGGGGARDGEAQPAAAAPDVGGEAEVGDGAAGDRFEQPQVTAGELSERRLAVGGDRQDVAQAIGCTRRRGGRTGRSLEDHVGVRPAQA